MDKVEGLKVMLEMLNIIYIYNCNNFIIDGDDLNRILIIDYLDINNIKYVFTTTNNIKIILDNK